jgi:hypothetical protein
MALTIEATYENGVLKPVQSAANPPPAKCNWRKGSNSSRNMHVLIIWRRHLAEGVAGLSLAVQAEHSHVHALRRIQGAVSIYH